MFEKFTKDARSVVIDAQQVARELRSPSIDSRHLLVALVAPVGTTSASAMSGGTVPAGLAATGLDAADIAARARRAIGESVTLDADALASVGIDLEEIRRRTDEVFGAGALERAGTRKARRGKHVPFTPDAKKALELALREAIRLQDKSIDSEHLLLGILRADCPAGRVLGPALQDAGSDVSTLRSALEGARAA